ncbi:MAG TPA: hypothetical protein VFM34_04805 [Moraxellaceae bacterium]|nr:hypothetical protein [Moraxellaceae bacterium]
MNVPTSLERKTLLLLIGGLLLTALLYLPGLNGPWLLDDFQNLAPLQDHPAGSVPYREIIFSNASGPLGRPVAMASFALNHALGLFSTPALKGTNLVLHLLNGLLFFLVFRTLFRRRAPSHRIAPDMLAAIIAVWWLLLPMHLGTVLYIVQRMTVLSTTFALVALLAYVHGRSILARHPRRGAVFVALTFFPLLPLAALAKESALTFIPALVIIELFWFRPAHARAWASGLALSTLALLLLTLLIAPTGLLHSYIGRDFTLPERLLSEPRALWAYGSALLMPGGASISVFHDDFATSRSLISPLSTLPALAGLVLLTGICLYVANRPRAWAIAAGLALFLCGHLIESTIVPLELYFEHRNYWSSAGLLLAIATLVTEFWPGNRRSLGIVAGLYLAMIAGIAAMQARIWGDEGQLLANAARYHPHSIAAQTSFGEYLLPRNPLLALQSVAAAAQDAPDIADVLGLQLISMHCRLGLTSPPALIQATAQALLRPRIASKSIAIGFDQILQDRLEGRCGQSDFTPLVPALIAYDDALVAHYGPWVGDAWPMRRVLGDWLLSLNEPRRAVALLANVWQGGNHADMPLAGLSYARALAAIGDRARLATTLQELRAVTADAPPDFQEEINRLSPAGTP